MTPHKGKAAWPQGSHGWDICAQPACIRGRELLSAAHVVRAGQGCDCAALREGRLGEHRVDSFGRGIRSRQGTAAIDG